MDAPELVEFVATSRALVPTRLRHRERLLGGLSGLVVVTLLVSGCSGDQRTTSVTTTAVVTETVTETVTKVATETTTKTVTQPPSNLDFGTPKEQRGRLEEAWRSTNQHQRLQLCAAWETDWITILEEYDEGLRVTGDVFMDWMDEKCPGRPSD